MKIVASLSLLAVVTACGTSKKSDKTPDTTPVVAIGNNLDTITPNTQLPVQVGEVSIVTPPKTESEKTDETKVEPKPAEKPVKEASKPVPESFVGFGFNTVESNVKELCLEGNVTLDSSNSSTLVRFNRYENYEAFKTTALGYVSGSFLNKWAGKDFQENFFAEYTAESLKANYVFASSLISGTKRFNSSKLAVALNPESFHNKCGNKFINSAVVGGSFVASVSLKFKDAVAKENFESERFDFSKLATLLQTEASYTEENRRVASVEITYAQIGGGGALVPNLNATDLLKCSLDNAESVAACVSTLEKVGNYAVSDAFVKSIKRAPAVYTFTLSNY